MRSSLQPFNAFNRFTGGGGVLPDFVDLVFNTPPGEVHGAYNVTLGAPATIVGGMLSCPKNNPIEIDLAGLSDLGPSETVYHRMNGSGFNLAMRYGPTFSFINFQNALNTWYSNVTPSNWDGTVRFYTNSNNQYMSQLILNRTGT